MRRCERKRAWPSLPGVLRTEARVGRLWALLHAGAALGLQDTLPARGGLRLHA